MSLADDVAKLQDQMRDTRSRVRDLEDFAEYEKWLDLVARVNGEQ